ncbi:MAG: polysaccharide deacetylase family protein [bacterium]|nr:polysaccharide deacetylase family protein [bacterium]
MNTFVALMYHNLEPVPESEYGIELAVFAAQLEWLGGHGFVAEGFPGLARRLAEGNPFPERYCVLSFDDGHASNLQAAEMVCRAGFQATFFLNRAASKRPQFLAGDGILELSRLCSLGSHGISHRSLVKMALSQVRRELRDSKQWLEEIGGEPIRWFSAPGGDADDRLRRLALEEGYRLIGNSVEWWNRPTRLSETRVVNRIMIFRSYTMRDFARILEQRPSLLVRRRLRSVLVSAGKRCLPESWIHRVSRWKRRIVGRHL